MSAERVALDGVARTMLMTLWFRALDARSAHPILGDAWAPDVVDRIDADWSLAEWGRGNAPVIAERGRRLDRWTQDFLDAHPDAQVLHLGCGLDSRPLRVRRPPTSRWIDVDQGEVVDLRRRLYDLPDDVEVVAGSVTDTGWWGTVDGGRPTLVVAEGLLMYLPADEVRALVDRVVDRLASGELLYDGVAGWLVPCMRLSALVPSWGSVRFAWAQEDLGRRRPGVRTVEDVAVLDLLAADPAAGSLRRTAYALGALVPPLRSALRLHRVRFG